jgi:GNAT superfamily N-acetyltransferase
MTTNRPGFTVRVADWGVDEAALHAVRHDVFVIEQNVPADLEWDGIDPECRHVIAVDAAGRAIGCGRLLPDGHVGRMAVRPEWRGRGVGAALLQHLVALARDRLLRAAWLRRLRARIRGGGDSAPRDGTRAALKSGRERCGAACPRR